MRKFIHFMFWPASRVKNSKIRHALYGVTILANAYRFTKSYEEARKKAENRVMIDAIKARQTRIHLDLVDRAIENNLITYRDADEAFISMIEGK